MIQSGKTVNARQTAFMLFAVVTAYKMINLPQALLEGAGRDAWIGALVLMGLEWLVLGLFLLISRLAPKRTMEQLLARVAGRTAMRVVMGLFGLFFCLRLLMTLTTTEQFLTANLYNRAGWISFGLPILLVMGYGATKGLRSIGRVNELLGVALMICMAVCVGAIAFQADFRLLLPVLHGGAGAVFRATETVLMGTGEALILLLLLGRTETARLGRNTLLALAAATVIVVLFHMSFYGFYGDAGVHLRHGKAISDMLQYMRGSDSLARIDVLIVTAILLLSLMKMLIYAWGAGVCVAAAFGWQRARRGRLWSETVVVGAVWIGSLLVGSRIFDFFSFLRGLWKYLLIVPFEVVLPAALLILALIAGRRREPERFYRLKDGVIHIGGVAHEPREF